MFKPPYGSSQPAVWMYACSQSETTHERMCLFPSRLLPSWEGFSALSLVNSRSVTEAPLTRAASSAK